MKHKSPKKLPFTGWTPLEHGVTQSLLQKFVQCRDRFHKHVVLGLRETGRKEAMEYGSIFHKLLELGTLLGKNNTRMNLLKAANTAFANKDIESVELIKTAVVQYFEYLKWEHDKPKYKYIAAEPVFRELYELPTISFNPCEEINIRIPSGIKIPLRGRIDEVLEINGHMWIQENKTKGRIDESMLIDTIPSNIQVMFYAVCSQLKYSRPCKGVIYNVIRKPALRQRQSESDNDFIERIKEDIQTQPDHYFKRYSYEFQKGQIEKWIREELNPLLVHVYLWWKSISKNPTVPWVDLDGNVNPFHGRKSFGVYDSMSQGKGDFYELIVNGRTSNLIFSKQLFPELEEDEGLVQQ
jgi:hypothetical protein